LNPIQILFSFKGRVNRQRFWLYIIAVSLVDFLLRPYVVTVREIDIALDWIIYIAYGMIFGWIVFALHIKRWHDRDKSGWWVIPQLLAA
jgi:uncharacterized membrane protein YhaH (DUF805 family)